MKKILFLLSILCVFINVKAEGNATLNNIRVNGKECKCIDYKCQIEIDSNSATITYDLDDESATVDRKSGFTKELNSLSETVKIIVSNTLNGEKIENTYEIVINQHEKSSDNTLSKLKINDNDIKIIPDVIVYSYTAKYDEDKLIVNATCNDSKASIKSKLEFDFPLDNSSGAFDFDVVAENGDKLTYRIVVQRGEKPNTYLKSLKLDKADIDFDKEILKYEIKVEYSINSLLVEAIAESDKATVKVEKDDLVVGENEIKVIVTNEKAESVYSIIVTREPNMDKSLANLKSLEINEYPKFNFEPNVLEYDLKFREIPEKLTIDAIPENSEGKVEIIGNEELMDKDKVIIKVTVDEIIIREYTLNIIENKDISSNKSIIIIAIIILVITMVILFILQIKEKKRKRKDTINKIKELVKKKKTKKTKVNVKKKKEEEEIEII